MDNKEFLALIEEFNTKNKEKKELERVTSSLSKKIKEELTARNLSRYVTETNLECKLVTKTNVTFDEKLLIDFLKTNNKQYLIKETPIVDAVKLEIKNRLIEEKSLANIISKKEVLSLIINEAKN